ncbi:acetyl-CoA carboxylase biotin carboxylase subunit [Rubellimicrobium arenae]|uniref:acetyl-CoA carboxylase biotin carboxylase subunit n=1 Tax=Rubellimicrobium arenae TaxID=2817372 RepID=UPI001B305985|nr:acetyl/propionyl/methylcrotonyl-CoA carboxylase subunit alpha [Rubellimicrobium arenae]
MFTKLLIANRGEIACRVMRTCRRLGIRTVAVYSEADARALHVQMADEAHCLGPAPASQSYLSIERVLEAVRATGAEAVHPGYGFLSENAAFAQALAEAGVAFVGPPAAAVEAMGDKITSKRLAQAAGVSTVPGHMGLVADAEEAVAIAQGIGYPVMIKASAGGGGKGMRIAWGDAEARAGFQASRNEAQAAFGDGRIFLEKFVDQPRHIEIQVLADAHGNVVHLHERECSVQRRNQKVVEEAPSPFLDAATRAAMGEQACALARAVGYQSAGTVEFIVDGARNFYFLEMNTRLQVEHPVTEMITGLDLVEQMIRVAAGEPLGFAQADVPLRGWAMESRVYAEDPRRGFLPSTGRLTRYRPPADGPLGGAEGGAQVRVDSGVAEGGEISRFYDPMIAKLVTWAETRAEAVEAMAAALDDFEIEGIGHNLPFLAALMGHPRFQAGRLSTAFIAEEWPQGFHGVTLGAPEQRRVAAAAAALHRVAEIRRARISGRLGHHARQVGSTWVVQLDGMGLDVTLRADAGGTEVVFADGERLRVEGSWTPGQSLARLRVGGRPLLLGVAPAPGGFRLRTQGAELRAHVRTPREAELAALMPAKRPPDTSRALLCPMPGLLTRLWVAEGEEVEAGQALATVEAMKMENTLTAERRGRVARVSAREGETLAVDQVILEFA